MKKAFNLLAIALIIVVTSGCSAFQPKTQAFSVTASPADATVTINGQQYKSPANVQVPRNETVSVTVSKKGYAPYSTAIGHKINFWGILDIVGTVCFLVPVIGIFTPGAWELEQSSVQANLTPEK